MHNKSVIFIAPRMCKGGAEKVISMLANELVKRNVCVGLALTIDDTITYELDSNVEIITNDKKSAIGQIRFIRKIMKEREHTVFVSFFTYQNVYSLLASLLLKTKVVVSERNDPRVSASMNRFVGFLRWLFYGKSYGIVFQTEDAMNYFPRRIRKKGKIISNPISPNLPDIFEGERDKRIVAVSRLNKQKNIPMMIRGLSKVFANNPEYSLEIYGEAGERNGDLLESLQELVKTEKMEDHIKFMGFSPSVTDLIKNACIYVNTSNYEGISNSMLEALALAIPSVCTDCPAGGAKKFIREGVNGYLVRVGDEEDFAEKVDEVLNNTSIEKTSISSAKELRKELDIKSITDKWCEVLKVFKEDEK